jgi:hypothetical protein
MKFWYQISPWRARVGIITWWFDEYLELQDCETGKYVIVHDSKCEVKNDSKK